MPTSTTSTVSIPNKLLAALPKKDYNKLRHYLEPVTFTLKYSLAVPGELQTRDGDLLRCTACAHRCVLADGPPDGIARNPQVIAAYLGVPEGNEVEGSFA